MEARSKMAVTIVVRCGRQEQPAWIIKYEGVVFSPGGCDKPYCLLQTGPLTNVYTRQVYVGNKLGSDQHKTVYLYRGEKNPNQTLL